jgi:20S proteasome alpha/beta subunit
LTLALAVFNNNGVILTADGLGSYGVMVGAQQVPYEKLHILGDRCACAEVGDLTKGRAIAEALKSSPLASESTLSKTGEQWLEVARATIKVWSSAFLANAVWVQGMHLNQQFAETRILLAGVASDGAFAYGINWLGEYVQPAAPHYLALGSGDVAARTYLDAYSYFAVADHPVLTLEALAARVMDKVAHNNMEVGGEISLIAIHRETSAEHPAAIEELSTRDARVVAALQHWQLAEDDVDRTLLMFTRPATDAQPPSEPSTNDAYS